MKILTNKGTYIEPDIGTKWVRKEITHNTHFSGGEPLKITNLIPCKKGEKERCIYRSGLSYYHDAIRDSLGGEACAGITIEYKYDGTGSICDQCYHTFIEGAERVED